MQMATTTTYDPLTGRATSPSHAEGPVAKAIEGMTSRLPSDLFLWSAGGAIVASLALQAMHKKQTGNFISQWVPTILLLGLYNKMVKLHGSEGHDGSDERD
jgi:hypothetical protein